MDIFNVFGIDDKLPVYPEKVLCIQYFFQIIQGEIRRIGPFPGLQVNNFIFTEKGKNCLAVRFFFF
jgi:hypothetical protein